MPKFLIERDIVNVGDLTCAELAIIDPATAEPTRAVAASMA